MFYLYSQKALLPRFHSVKKNARFSVSVYSDSNAVVAKLIKNSFHKENDFLSVSDINHTPCKCTVTRVHVCVHTHTSSLEFTNELCYRDL